MSVFGRILTRTAAFLIKESIVALGQPRLLLSVIVGPFLLLLVFGLGFSGQRDPFQIVLVVPQRPDVPTRTEFYQRFFFWQLHLSGVTTDQQAALGRLKRRERGIDAVIVAPIHPLTDLAANQPAVFEVYFNDVDPIARVRLESLIYGHTRELNTRIEAALLTSIFQAAGVKTANAQSNQNGIDALRTQVQAGDSNGALGTIDRMLAAVEILRLSGEGIYGVANAQPQAKPEMQKLESELLALRGDLAQKPGNTAEQDRQISELQQTARDWPDVTKAAARVTPERLAAPVDYDLKDLAPSGLSYVHYYAPVVLVLLLQHVAITLAALSVILERTRGTVELFRVAPVRLGEILLGKALSLGAILGILAAILIVLLVFTLGEPLLGSVGLVALVMALLIAIGLSLGFIIAAVSSSESQAVQLAMLVLLLAVFFGGLFVPIDTLTWPVRGIAYATPVTHAGTALQTIMLRGDTVPLQQLGALGLMTAILVPVAVLLMQRSFRMR